MADAETKEANPEVGETLEIMGAKVNCHIRGKAPGTAPAIVLIHASGPGVSAYANWATTMPQFEDEYCVIGPDLIGFGDTIDPPNPDYSLELWADQVVAILDHLGIDKAHLIGNSLGGGVALRAGVRHPDRVARMALMGPAGSRFEMTEGLDFAWGYTPSIENMKKMLDYFAYDRSLVTDDLAKLRYEASAKPGRQERYAKMWPAPRQRHIERLSISDEDLRKLPHHVLFLHGVHDYIVPFDCSVHMVKLIENADLYGYARCGHWVQYERRNEFIGAIKAYFAAD